MSYRKVGLMNHIQPVDIGNENDVYHKLNRYHCIPCGPLAEFDSLVPQYGGDHTAYVATRLCHEPAAMPQHSAGRPLPRASRNAVYVFATAVRRGLSSTFLCPFQQTLYTKISSLNCRCQLGSNLIGTKSWQGRCAGNLER